MNIEEVRLLIKQLGKELYEDNPERQARGPFSVDKYKGPMTKEEKLADVEAYQAEMLEKEAYRDALMELEDALVDASPSVGEKLIANFLNLFPMGKRSTTGIGSLLGKEIGGMTEAEAARIKDIEQELYKLNSIFQKEGRGLKEIESLRAEKEGIMSMLGKTPLAKKPSLTVENSTVNVLDENFAKRNPGAVKSIRGAEGQFYPTKNVDALKKLSPTDSKNVLEIFKAEKRSLKMMPEVQMYGSKEKAEVFRDIDKQYEEIFNILNSNIKGYKDGGVIMNYGDYGRNYI
tara:strand:- start:84 stop:950 length:867 start_codon:yes stop_codon:yes gene_type:complete